MPLRCSMMVSPDGRLRQVPSFLSGSYTRLAISPLRGHQFRSGCERAAGAAGTNAAIDRSLPNPFRELRARSRVRLTAWRGSSGCSARTWAVAPPSRLMVRLGMRVSDTTILRRVKRHARGERGLASGHPAITWPPDMRELETGTTGFCQRSGQVIAGPKRLQLRSFGLRGKANALPEMPITGCQGAT